MSNNYPCRLCNHNMLFFTHVRNKEYFRCPNCDSIQLHKKFHLSKREEQIRYETHNNDIFDPRYQNFVSPITNFVIEHFEPNDIGLDYGAGPGPVISKVLKDHHYQIKSFDPYFHKNQHLLNEKYNYIIACEVIEHFNNPSKEFTLLKNCLKPKGALVLMTELYDDEINFDQWYYKNDETHIIFYTKKTLNYIKNRYEYESLSIHKRLIVFN